MFSTLLHNILRRYHGRKYFSHNIKAIQIDITQGGKLYINTSQILSPLSVIVESFWQDHIEIINSNLSIRHKLVTNKVLNQCYIDVRDSDQPSSSFSESLDVLTSELIVRIPELMSLDIQGNELNLSLCQKILGDVFIVCQSGNIEIDKIRGEKVSFQLGQADLRVKKVLEATKAIVVCRYLHAKMINGNHIDIHSSHGANIGAMYTLSSSISTSNQLQVGLLRGSTKVHSQQGDVAISSIDGSLDVMAENGRIELQINRLLPNSKSQLISKKGSIFVKVDPLVEALVDCEGEQNATRGIVTIISNSFLLDPLRSSSHRSCGVLQGRHELSSRSISPSTAATSGKINISEANSQSLHTVISSNHSSNYTSSNMKNRPDGEKSLPELILKAAAHVRLESLSWIDVIRQKHGLETISSSSSSASSPTSSTTLSSGESIKIPQLGRTVRADRLAQEILQSKLKSSSSSSSSLASPLSSNPADSVDS